MKLYYFDFAGRAEAIRLLLTHAGQKFEDIRVKMADWPKMKDSLEGKQLPILEIDGKKYNQSYAILEYLGAKYGYLPKSFDKLYKVMFVMNTAEDVAMKAYRLLSPVSVYDAKGKEEGMKQLLEVEGPLYMKALENMLKANCTQDFIVGKKYTVADFFLMANWVGVTQIESWRTAFQDRIIKKYPVLYAYVTKRMADFNTYYKKCKTKLTYFDIPGRGEMIRAMLKYLNIPFEDIRIKFEEWPALKATGKFELQQLPVLECEPCGLKICQSDAIMHRIGARYGLLPLNKPEKLYNVIWWCNTLKDIIEGMVRFYQPIPEDKKKQMRADFFEKTVPLIFQMMESRLKSNKTQCCVVGRSKTIADFYLIGTWRGIMGNPMFPEFAGIAAKYPTLNAYMECANKSL